MVLWYRDCLLVRSATYVSTFGVLLCRAVMVSESSLIQVSCKT